MDAISKELEIVQKTQDAKKLERLTKKFDEISDKFREVIDSA